MRGLSISTLIGLLLAIFLGCSKPPQSAGTADENTNSDTTTHSGSDSDTTTHSDSESDTIACKEAKLLDSDGAPNDMFGHSAAASGNIVLVGAPGDLFGPNNTPGSASLFERNKSGIWEQKAKLMASDGVVNDWFGFAVSVGGNTALVGAPNRKIGEEEHSGVAYIFQRDAIGTWEQKAKLLNPDDEGRGSFGWSVSLDGNTALVGAATDDSAGAAYIYERDAVDTWQLKATLLPSDRDDGDNFGYSVSLSGDTALVGALMDDAKGQDSGSAYIFVRHESGIWEQKAKLLASDGVAYQGFGFSAAIINNIAVVGALFEENDTGAAYVFERNEAGTWEQKSKLLASDRSQRDQFGVSVSVASNIALIGAFDDDDGSGSAYVFERNEAGAWEQKSRLVASDRAAADGFGRSVSISGDDLLIGARGDDDKDDNAGSAYILCKKE